MVLDLAGGRERVLSWGLAFATMGAVVALGPVFVLLLNRAPRLARVPQPAATPGGG
jgi:hypothetical protein